MLFYRAFISSRVVGYSNNDVIKGSQGAGITFVAVSGSTTMADLKITGYDPEEGYADNGITAVKLDTYGRNAGDTMCWIDYQDEEISAYGWYSDDGEKDYNKVALAPGEGLWFKSPSPDFKILSSGQVLPETLPVMLIAGSQLCANPTPVTLNMGNIWMTGYDPKEGYADNGITAVKLDTYGRNAGDTMCWIDYQDEEISAYGWYSDDGEKDYNTVKLAPGESVWLKCPKAGWMVNFPSPLSK